MKRYLIIGVSLIIILVILSITVLVTYSWLPANIQYHIKKTFRIYQNGDGVNINLGIIVPKSGPYQTVKNLNIIWNGDQEKNSLAHIETIRLSDHVIGGQDLEAIVEYDIILPQGKASWQAPIEEHHLLPQVGIESDHPQIIQTANEISNGSGQHDAFEIYQFTSDHLEYSEYGCEDTNVSALEAYQSGIGACIGYSRLMVALCRASGIPAKMIIGSILPDILFSLPEIISSGTPGGGHAWVEYNSQDNWYLADPSWGKGYASLLPFNRNDGRHLSFGEFEQFSAAKRDLVNWATERTSSLDEELMYVFAADSDQIEIASETSIRKTWDGRWVNTLLTLALVTYLLCKIRDRLISKNSKKNQ